MFTAYFLQGLGLGFSAAATPGSLQAFYLSQTSQRGLWRSLPLALVPLVSDGPIVLLVLLVLIQTPSWLITLLRLAGGLFLFYLAWGAWKARKISPSALPGENGKGFLKGVVMNLLNPGPYLFWSMIGGPILLQGWQQSPWVGGGFLGAFYLTMICGCAALIVLFALAHRMDRRMTQILSLVSVLAFVGLGFYQVYAGLTGLLGL